MSKSTSSPEGTAEIVIEDEPTFPHGRSNNPSMLELGTWNLNIPYSNLKTSINGTSTGESSAFTSINGAM